MNNKHKEDAALLEILQEIEHREDITQRHLANKLDVALGLANSYLKRCVRKGLVKVTHAPANRYFYYLTPKGFTEKSRLTAKYLSTSFNFYRSASESINNVYSSIIDRELRNIIFCGVSEFAEIAAIRAHDFQISILGVYDPRDTKTHFLGLPVWNDFNDCAPYDALLITALSDSQLLFEELTESELSDIVFVPSILGLNTQ